jgi:hypothetical protein
VLTVVTTCRIGARPIYGPWHVLNVREMFRRHLTVPHRFVCVTDDVPAMERAGIEAVQLWPNERPDPESTRQHWLDNYCRLGLLGDPGKQIGDRILGVDLDIVVRANINSLVETDAPVKFMCLRSRTWIQGGLILATPGALCPDPWRAYNEDDDLIRVARAEGFCGSDQAVLSLLFYDAVSNGEFEHWDESDGVSVNEIDQPDWRIFFRTGDRKCWDDGQPERELYYANCGADPATCPDRPRPPLSGRTPGGLVSRVPRYCKLPGRPRQ